MKKYLKIVIPIVFIVVLGYLGFQIFSKIQYKNEVAEHIKTIPFFNYENVNGKSFTREDLKLGAPTLFIYFNTECEFCIEETIMIYENIAKFANCQLVFISFEKKEIIKDFAKINKLDTYDNVHFLCDNQVTFATTFDVKSLPCLVLYDKNNNLIEKIKGQTKAETLIKKLNKE